MPYLRLISWLISCSLLLFASCEKEEPDFLSPVLDTLELGTGPDPVFHTGQEILFECELSDNDGLDYVTINIDKTSGNSLKNLSGEKIAWSFKKIIDSVHGQKRVKIKNPGIFVPLNAEDGLYTFTISVFDLHQNQTDYSTDFSIHAPSDTVPPVLSIKSRPSNNTSFSQGDTIRVTGCFTDNYRLGEILIAIVSEYLFIPDTSLNTENVSAVLFYDNSFMSQYYPEATESPNEIYENIPVQFDFDAFIIAGAPADNMGGYMEGNEINWTRGDYYLVLKIADAYGNITYSPHYPFTYQ
ncbi:MAG: DUF4625 domain-containing protein [Bacteroidales bacterium]